MRNCRVARAALRARTPRRFARHEGCQRADRSWSACGQHRFGASTVWQTVGTAHFRQDFLRGMIVKGKGRLAIVFIPLLNIPLTI